jgi:hypothetical protein
VRVKVFEAKSSLSDSGRPDDGHETFALFDRSGERRELLPPADELVRALAQNESRGKVTAVT